MPEVKMTFTVEWHGAESATLHYLFDGGLPVPLERHQTTGRGKIVVTYTAPDTGGHQIEWGLTFPGKKLKQLAASASVGDGAAQPLDRAEEEKHLWKSEGRVVG